MPFCRTICSYCDFCHQVYRTSAADAWLKALGQEMDAAKINDRLATIYLGGGTPTALDETRLEQLFRLIEPYSHEVMEYTVEVNPESFTPAKAALFKKYGVTRASIGYQTDEESMLKLMNRNHTAEDVGTCMELLRAAGITDLSLDIMYGLPGQTTDRMKESVLHAVSFHPTHLSLYSLQIEESTVFGRTGVQPVSEETEADMYDWICTVLPEYGYHQYEISNFSKPGFESKHNLVYWNYGDFYGLSCGASGKEGDCRYDKPRSLQAYIRDPYHKEEIPLDRADRMFEYLMMGLRKTDGISASGFHETFGVSVESVYGTQLDQLFREQLLKREGDRIFCSVYGFHILNTVLESFL